MDGISQSPRAGADSPRAAVNHGLALLRASQDPGEIAELERSEKQDPKIPHTWFNLGIAFKKAGDYEKALWRVPAHGGAGPRRRMPPNLGVLERSSWEIRAGSEAVRAGARPRSRLLPPRASLTTRAARLRAAKEDTMELRIVGDPKLEGGGFGHGVELLRGSARDHRAEGSAG